MAWRPSFFILSLAVLSATATAADPDPFEAWVAPFFREHCLRCHSEKRQKGDFRIDTLSRNFEEGHDAELWFEVITRIGGGEMPPEEETQPGPEESARIIEWLDTRIKKGESARMGRRSPVALYRLSREEYSHTVYDLLGVRYDTRAPGAFSEDPAWHGFERLGSELSLAPSHVEKYLQAAREVIELAYPDPAPKLLQTRRDALDIDWPNRDKRRELEAIGVAERVRTLIWPGHELSYLRPSPGHGQAPGLYRARLQVSGLTPEGDRPPHLTLFSKALDRMIFEADVLAPEDEPAVLEFETFLPAGRFDIAINNAVPGPSNSGRSGRPGGFVLSTLDDPKSRAPWQRKMTDDDGRPLYPFLIFDWIEWEGPIENPDDLAKCAAFLPPGESSGDLRASLAAFAGRAWRRPLSEGEVDRYLAIATGEIAQGTPFREAWRIALQAILASKNFFYLTEGSPGQNRPELTGEELASRLSYFLWSSLPDAELLAAARAGNLGEPAVLRSQVARMMADPKMERFTASFPRQWLQLKRVGEFPPDEKLYPDYDGWLEESMIQETLHFFAEVFRENLPLREFLDSHWTMLNPRLALHYGLQAPAGSGWQRVALPPEARRGGILTHASILSLTSDGARHRPVHRGVWISEAIFGKTPPPPPPNVPAIEPNPLTEPKATIRMKLAAHAMDPNCASCHARIDPLGLAFDHYDAIGRWRCEEIVADGTGANPPVDASGRLPDGRSFADAAEFKRLLTGDIDRFARAFAEKLAVYGLRRTMTFDDHAALDAIVASAGPPEYRLRDLIEQFVLSGLFLKR